MRWDADKNEILKAGRGVSFEALVVAIGAGGVLDVLPHPSPERYPGQSVLVVAAEGYAYLVPFVEEREYIFLKTVIPSRKATRDYLMRGGRDGET
jgi:putative transposon-encoded protein